MNKIELVGNKVKSKTLDSAIHFNKINNELVEVKKIEITIVKDTTLNILFESEEAKLDVVIHVLPNVVCSIFERKQGTHAKVRYQYFLEENSDVSIVELSTIFSVKENTYIYLKGEQAKIHHHLKTLATAAHEYEYIVYHEAKYSESHLFLHAINTKQGSTSITTSGFVTKGLEECVLNHNSHIVQLNEKKCTIKPNLLIDEYNVTANHSALIDQLKKEDLFYLESRGISEKEATTLLLLGFFLSGVENYQKELEEEFQKYWR